MKNSIFSVSRVPVTVILGLGLASLLVAQTPPSPPASPQPDTAVLKHPMRSASKAIEWAGAEGPLLGESLSRFNAFMADRKSDIRAGAKTPWNEWLTELSASKNKTLKVWALTRLVEAGSYTKFPELTEAMVQHVRGGTQGGSGLVDSVLDKGLPWTFGYSAPTYLIHEASPFWASLDATIRKDPERTVGGGFYTIWCYNTRPSQRDLIEEIARHIKSPLTAVNPHPDPWNDPRFWIVMDWAIAWGEQQDLDRLGQLIPEGPARREYIKRTKHLLNNPVFSSCRPPTPLDDRKWDADSQLSPAAALGLDIPGMVNFSQVRVKHQPPVFEYPQEAKIRRVMGTNVVMLKIDAAGIPCQARPAPGPWLAFLAPASLDYAKDWRFEPQKENGVAVDSKFLLNIVYRLH